MGVGYCEVPMSVIRKDMEFMELEAQVKEMKRQAQENEDARNNNKKG